MRRLVALALPGGEPFVTELRRAWDAGDAVLPLDPRLPGPSRQRVLDAMRPSVIVAPDGTTALDGGRPVDDGDALVVATSGSTGEPKGVVLTHDAVQASASATSARIGVTADDVWLACLPLAHVGGLSVVTRALATGNRVVVHDGFEPARAVSAGATLVSLVPTALARIDPSAFRIIVLGGSRPPADRPAHVLATYGMTETGSGVVYEGRPLDGVEVRVAADGEIHLRGPMLLRCYRNDHDPKTADGWLPTGDLGGITSDGRLFVEGRRGDMVNTGGEKVWPEAVEAVLRRHPDVADAAVLAEADHEWGQRVTALVVATPGTSPALDALRDFVKIELPAYCAPRRLVLVPALPRTTLGKLQRALLPGLLGG